MRATANFLKALGDETRLQILALLFKEGELCVCDFEKVLGVTQSKSSRHLRYLLNAGVLQDRREAVWVYYRISEDLTPELKTIMKAVSSALKTGKLTTLEKRFARWQQKKAAQPCLPQSRG